MKKMIGFLKVAQFKATFLLDYDDQYQEMTNEARQPIKIQVSQLKHGSTAFPFWLQDNQASLWVPIDD